MENPVCEVCEKRLYYPNKRLRRGYTTFQHNENGIKIIVCEDCLHFSLVVNFIYKAKEKRNDSNAKNK